MSDDPERTHTSKETIMDWLKQNWFILAALATASVAWGQQQQKIQTLENAIKDQKRAE